MRRPHGVSLLPLALAATSDAAARQPHTSAELIVDFEQRVLREVATNPSFYVEQAVNEVAGELVGPYLRITHSEPVSQSGKRLFVVAEDHWFTGTCFGRSKRLDPLTDI